MNQALRAEIQAFCTEHGWSRADALALAQSDDLRRIADALEKLEARAPSELLVEPVRPGPAGLELVTPPPPAPPPVSQAAAPVLTPTETAGSFKRGGRR